jgi:hypothetical protein
MIQSKLEYFSKKCFEDCDIDDVNDCIIKKFFNDFLNFVNVTSNDNFLES